MGLTGWGCIYRQHGGTTSKMPALLGFLQNFQVLLAERIPRIFLQLQIRNSGRENIQMIPFRIWKMLTCLSPTSYLYTCYLCWDVSLIVGALSSVSCSQGGHVMKTREGWWMKRTWCCGGWGPAPSQSLKPSSKGWSRHRKGMTFISLGECGA